jgi:hypothetical protein
MNILDIEKSDVKKCLTEFKSKDTFDLLLKIGKKYQSEYEINHVNIDTKEGQKELRRISWYIVEELCEMINLLKIREWSSSEYPTDQIHFAEEYADFMNFVIQIPLLLKWDEDKVKDIIIRKYLVNKFRRSSKY